MRLLGALLVILIAVTEGKGPFSAPFFKKNLNEKYYSVSEVGKPLFITPLLEAGKWGEAQELSKVVLKDAPNVISHSGFVTVNKKFDSNMFFWYFPAEFKPETSPLLIWLQGGPGGSSLFGLFTENGPFVVNSDGKVTKRQTSWTLTHNVIYIDNPVGTGFSFTKNGFAENQTAVAEDLFELLIQIYTLFPDLKDRDLYVTGESFAGKYVPAFSYKIHQENQLIKKEKGREINFKGLAIGDGLVDPVSQMDYGDFLYNIGLFNSTQKAAMDEMSKKAKTAIANKDWVSAYNTFDKMLSGDAHPSLFTNMTGFTYYFNLLFTEEPADYNYFTKFLEKAETRKGIHVGNLSFSDQGPEVERYLITDFCQSVKPWLEKLIDADYKVLMYNGQLDIIIANTLTVNMINSMEWKGKKEYLQAEKKKWMIGNDLSGYSTSAGNFTYLLVLGAGHMVPHDQPKRAFDLINRFTRGKPF